MKQNNQLRIVIGVFITACLTSCQGDQSSQSEPPVVSQYQPEPARGNDLTPTNESEQSNVMETAPGLTGSIKGTITYVGKVPKLRPINMEGASDCHTKHETPIESQLLVLGENNEMANVIVRITTGLPQRKYHAPKEPATLDQKGCIYIPRVLVVMAGQPLRILNSDGLMHNIHPLPKVNRVFNRGMPATVTEITERFDKAEEPFPVKCDVHPWMKAYICVMDHPFFDVTQKNGKYEISDLPSGTYKLKAWHEKLGTQVESVTVVANEVQAVSFSFSR